MKGSVGPGHHNLISSASVHASSITDLTTQAQVQSQMSESLAYTSVSLSGTVQVDTDRRMSRIN